MEPYAVARFQGLELRQNPVGVVDVAPEQVLEPVVAIEARFALPHLYEPRPHFSRGSANGNGVRSGKLGVGNELISGELLADFRGRGAPLEVPGPDIVWINHQGDRPDYYESNHG